MFVVTAYNKLCHILSDVLRFITTAVKLMFSSSETQSANPDNPRDPSWTNIIIGISCFCYWFPLISNILFTSFVRSCHFYEGILWFITALNSFGSDYVFFGNSSIVHIFDRWTATTGVLITGARVILLNYRIFSVVFLLGTVMYSLVTLFFLHKSRDSHNKFHFRRYHFLWHFFGGLLMAGVDIVEYAVFVGMFV